MGKLGVANSVWPAHCRHLTITKSPLPTHRCQDAAGELHTANSPRAARGTARWVRGWTEHQVAAATRRFPFSHTLQPPLPLRSSSGPKKLGTVAVAVVGRVAAEMWWQMGKGVPFSHTYAAAAAAAAMGSGTKRPGTAAVAAWCV